MPKEIFEWSTAGAGNGLFAPVDGGWPEGMSRQDVNDASREDLAALRRWYNDSEWIRPRIQGPNASNVGVFARTGANTCTITLAGVDLSSYFRAGRIVKIINGSGVGVDLVTQCSINATYGVGVTTITTKATINVAATDIYTHSDSVLRAQALLDDNSQFFIPATADSAGIQAAIDAADAAGGGIVFLNQSSYSIGTQIDITGTKGNVVIWGKSPQVTLLRTAGIGSIINYSNANKALEIRNVKFDGDWLANPSGNGYGLSIGSCLSASIENCDFVRCESGIRITGASNRRMVIRGCNFTFHRYGISTASAADTHEGVIEGCQFDGSLQSLAAPASIRVSGSWKIANNHLRNWSHATLVPVGIYVWDRTVTDFGGIRSTVTGNVLVGAAATGIGIWIGSLFCTCIGNTVSGGASTTGIRLGSNTAAAFAEQVICSGNAIVANSLGIQVTEFCRHSIVSGNAMIPLNTGISVGGDLMVISQNTIRNVPVGIDVLATAIQCSLLGNTLTDVTSDGIILRSGCNAIRAFGTHITGTPTRGVNIESGAVNPSVVETYAPSLTSPITNADATSRIARNQEHVMVSEASGNAGGGTVDVITNQDLPGGGGIGTYLVEYLITNNTASAANVNLYFGATGSPASDTLLDSNSIGASATEENGIGQIQLEVVTDALWTKWSVRKTGTSGDVDVAFRITKVSEPLG